MTANLLLLNRLRFCHIVNLNAIWWDSEGEPCIAETVGYRKIPQRDDVHADQQIIVSEISRFGDSNIRDQDSVRETNIDQVGVCLVGIVCILYCDDTGRDQAELSHEVTADNGIGCAGIPYGLNQSLLPGDMKKANNAPRSKYMRLSHKFPQAATLRFDSNGMEWRRFNDVHANATRE